VFAEWPGARVGRVGAEGAAGIAWVLVAGIAGGDIVGIGGVACLCGEIRDPFLWILCDGT
jgi:hypothetical protein